MIFGEIMNRKSLVVTVLTAAALILTACGGGGNNMLEMTIEAEPVASEPAPITSNLNMNLCEEVDLSGTELTFAVSYCLGNFCTGENEAECDNIDEINGNDMTQYGQDGLPDCKWISN